MGAVLKIVPDEDMKILKKYLDEDGVVLISQSTVDKISDPAKKKAVQIVEGNGGYFEYDFGGEADIWVDIVDTDEHMALDYIASGAGLYGDDESDKEDGRETD